MATPWQKQTDTPLFEDFFWQLPQTKRTRGKILIVGGSGQQFSSISKSHNFVTQSGAGQISMALPSSLQSIVPSSPTTHFLLSTKTNTISAQAIGQLKNLVDENDLSLFAGDLGRSSQTSQLLAALHMSSFKPCVLTGDSINLFSAEPHILLDRSQTTLVLGFGQLQRLLDSKTSNPISSSMGLVLLVLAISELKPKAAIVTKFQEKIIVWADGEVSVTDAPGNDDWSLETASIASVFLMQQPDRRFATLTSAIFMVTSKKTLSELG